MPASCRGIDGGHVSLAGLATMTVQDGLLITLAGPAAQRRYFPLQQEFSDDLEDDMGRFDTAQARTLLSVSRGADQTPVSTETTARDFALARARRPGGGRPLGVDYRSGEGAGIPPAPVG